MPKSLRPIQEASTLDLCRESHQTRGLPIPCLQLLQAQRLLGANLRPTLSLHRLPARPASELAMLPGVTIIILLFRRFLAWQ